MFLSRTASCVARHAIGIGAAIGLVVTSLIAPPLLAARPDPVNQAPAPSPAEPTETQIAAFTEAQTSLWSEIFDRSDDPQVFFWLNEGESFAGVGKYQGTNVYGDTFDLRVWATIAGPSGTSGSTAYSTGHVVANVIGPTNLVVPVMGTVFTFTTTSATYTGVTFATRLSNETAGDMGDVDAGGEAMAGQWSGLTQTQQGCAASCDSIKNAQIIVALAAMAAAALVATAALAVALILCASAAGFPGLGLLLGSICALNAMIIYFAAMMAAAIILAAALNLIAAVYLACLRACGILIYEA